MTDKINVDLRANIHNRFDVEVIDAVTGKVKQTAVGHNIILNQLWNRLFTPTGYFSVIHYGSGTGILSPDRTSLFSFAGAGFLSDTIITKNDTQGWISLRRQVQLSEQTAVGVTLTEVGIGYSNTAQALVTHALLKDMNGNTISITKTDTDIINIYATVFVHWNVDGWDNGYNEFYPYPETIVTFSTLASTTAWMLGMGAINTSECFAWFASGQNRREPFSGTTTSLKVDRISQCTLNYNLANKQLTFTANRLAINQINIPGGIYSITMGRFTPPGTSADTKMPTSETHIIVGGTAYPGSTIIGEAIGTGDGIKKDFATKFTMVSNASVYVDGVKSIVTIDENIPSNLTNFGRNFRMKTIRYTAATPSVWGKSAHSCMLDSWEGATAFLYGDAAEVIYYNSFYNLGISQFKNIHSNCAVAVSLDGKTWNVIASGLGSVIVTVPVQYRKYPYWKIYNLANGDTRGITAMHCEHTNTNNIHFSTPPAAGTIITANYFTKTIAKDENHVFDFSCTITVGEKT